MSRHRHSPTSSGVTHSKEKALSETEFERLLNGAMRIDDPYYRLQSRFVVLVLGRLGLRCSELAHMDESWINWRDRRITIPSHEPCDKGRGGGLCGSCRQKARQRVEHSDDPAFDFDAALEGYWRPKTTAAQRGIYYGHDARTEMVLRDFFDEWSAFPLSVQGVARRIERAASQTTTVDGEAISPHPLRATAATFLAGRGVQMSALQQHFGWADARVALKYVQTSPERTARQLDATRSR